MFMKNKKERINPLSSAETKDCIDAEKEAALSTPHTGEDSFDAESNKKAAEFEKLIRGEFKKEFSDKVSKIISRRLKEVKELQRKLNTENTERMSDESMADTQNNTYNDLLKRLIMENAFLKKENEKRMRDTSKMSLAEKIRAQAEETKAVYGDFDLKKELQNPEFCRLVKLGVSVKNAYEVVNLGSILDNKSKEAEKTAIDSIRNKSGRPVENGSELTGGILLSGGISKLTKKQRAELAKRAGRGEKISF